MSRHQFGMSPSDWTFTVGTANAATLAGGVTITVWDNATSGTRLTDLLDSTGSPITSVTSSTGTSGLPLGTIPLFYGPDGVTQLWADAGGGYRSLLTAHDAFASTEDPRFGQIAGVTMSGTPAAGRGLALTGSAAASWADSEGTGAWIFNIRSRGAVGDGKIVTDGAMTSGSAVLTSATAPFVPGDVGKVIQVKGAAATGVTTLVATIASYTSATSVTLSASASTTVTSAQVMWGTDDTAAIQASIDAAVTYAQNNAGMATVFVPPAAGFYCVGGALVTGGATKGNAQITLPVIPVAGKKIVITIRGSASGAAVQHWQQTVPQYSGALVSFGVFSSTTAQTTSITNNGNPSVIGGPAQPGGYGTSALLYSNMMISLRDLSILTTYSLYGLTYSAFDFSGVACAELDHVAYGTAGSVVGGDYLLPAQFSAGLSFGGLLPANGNNDACMVDNVVCHGGYTYAFLATEHAVINRMVLLYCWSALCVSGSYNTSVGASHAFWANQLSVESCINVLYIFGQGAAGIGPFVDIQQLDTEVGAPIFADNNAGVGLAAALGTVRLTGLYTAANVATSGGAPTGLKIIDGQKPCPVRTITATTTVSIVDETILVDASGGPVTVNLISAVATPNTYTIKKIDSSANAVTIDGAGSQTIDGATTRTLTTQWQSLTLVPSGGNWYIV